MVLVEGDMPSQMYRAIRSVMWRVLMFVVIAGGLAFASVDFRPGGAWFGVEAVYAISAVLGKFCEKLGVPPILGMLVVSKSSMDR